MKKTTYINVITVRQNDMIQKTRNKLRSKIKIKHWIILAVDKFNGITSKYIKIAFSIQLLMDSTFMPPLMC